MRGRIISLLIIGLVLAPDAAVGQTATPAGSPVAGTSFYRPCNAGPMCDIPGLSAYVYRIFDYSGNDVKLPQGVQFGVIQFTTADQAHAALIPLLQTGLSFGEEYDDAAMTPTSLRLNDGDEAIAVSGPVIKRDGQSFSAAFIVVREGRYVRYAVGWQMSGAPLDALAAMFSQAFSRSLPPSSPAVTRDSFGLFHGGLWDALPALAELPQGYRFFSQGQWTNSAA